MFVVVQDPAHKPLLRKLIKDTPQLGGFEVYDAEIDYRGLHIEIN